uniref:Uncharacterized protein n=1 Tax=Trichogramma kaykai TaxID=54128 RepID=A0ABD2X1P0_9HYME
MQSTNLLYVPCNCSSSSSRRGSCRNEAAPRRVRFIFHRECVGGEISTRKHNNKQRVEAQKEARTEKTETK